MATETLEDAVEEELEAEVPADDIPAVDPADDTTATDDDSGEGLPDAAGTEPVASSISAEMKALAGDYGLDPEAFGSDQNIRAAVTLLDRQAAEWAKSSPQWQQRTKEVPSGQNGQQRPNGQPPETPPQQPPAFDLDKLFPKEQYDEGLVGGIKALYQHLAGQLDQRVKPLDEFGQLKEQLSTLQQYHQQQESQRFESEMDGCFKELGDEWKATFGNAAMRSLPNGSPLKEARQRLVDQIDALQHADILRNRPLKQAKQYFDAALRSAFGQQTDTAARKKVLTDLGKRKGTALARGNSKASANLTPEQKAFSTLRAKLKEYSAGATEDDEE